MHGPARGHRGGGIIACWTYGLIRDAGAILLDINPDKRMAEKLRQTIEGEGNQIADLHLWRLEPRHLGAIVSVITRQSRGPAYYRARLAAFPSLSHRPLRFKKAYRLAEVLEFTPRLLDPSGTSA